MLKNVLRLFLFSILFSILVTLAACAPKRIEIPVYEGGSLRDALASRSNISSMDTTFSVTFEKEDAEIKGDGAVNIADSGDMNMRIYSFGFLAFELSSKEGVVKSNPPVDRNKAMILTYGLRDCLFWWDMKDYETMEKDGNYILLNSRRQIWIDVKTLLPSRQTLYFEDGRELNITYENPEKFGDFWYPSKMRIEFAKYAVVLRLKELSLVRRS